MVNKIYQPELQLNKANTSDTEAPFLDLHPSISNGFVSSKIYDKRDYPYGVYTFVSQLIRFARVSSHVDDFNARNKCLTANLLKKGYRHHKLSKFYRRHHEWFQNSIFGLKSLLHQGLSEPEFYGNLVYKFKKIMGKTYFPISFEK